MRKRRLAWGLWLIFAAALYYFENNLGTRTLLCVSIILPCLLYLLARNSVSAKLEIKLPNKCQENEVFECVLKASGLMPGVVLDGYLVARNIDNEVIFTEVICGLSSGENIVKLCSTYTGSLTFSFENVSATDMFGLWQKNLNAKASIKTLIKSKAPANYRIINETMPSLDAEMWHNSRPGNDPSETFGIREYHPGDPIKQIHWKLSEKTGITMLRELGLPVENRTRLVYDDNTENEDDVKAENGEIRVVDSANGFFTAHKTKIALLSCFVALIALAMCFILPMARNGLAQICNMIFAASEARNAYVYSYFNVAEGSIGLAIGLIVLAALAIMCLAFVFKARFAALIALIAFAITEIYFGLVPASVINVLIVTVLGAFLVRKLNIKNCSLYLGSIIIVFGIMGAIFPGANARIEASSELARDRLDRIEQLVSSEESKRELSEMQKTHQENRLDKVEGNVPETDDVNKFENTIEYEQEISKPKRINYAKIALMLLLVLAVLIVPFAPFLLFDSRRKLAQERRKLFDSEDYKEAISAMFLHVNSYLQRGEFEPENSQFSACIDRVAEVYSEDYAKLYAEGVKLWQEACYSSHEMSLEQRNFMQNLLDKTEDLIYNNADNKTKFVLKYVECLHA